MTRDTRSILGRCAGALRAARMLVTATLGSAAVFLPFAYAGPERDLGYSGYWLLATCVPVGLFAAGGLRIAVLWRARRLADTVDIGGVIEALEDTDRDVRTVAATALGPLLAAVGPETRLQLSSEQYAILLAALPVAPTSLAVPMLAAFRVIGDSRAD